MQEGSGAFGARVLSFVRFAPNDGFGPESASPSGLVQRGVMYAASGGDTTTLSHAVAVKLKNPKNLRPAGAVNLHAQRACQMGAATTLSREAAVAP